MVPEYTPEQLEAMRVNAAAERKAQWKGAIEQELQSLVNEAAGIREKITTAKTQYKKEFYSKKFSKVQSRVMQMLVALQRLEAQDVAQDHVHVHDEHCNHDHEEEQKDAEPTTETTPAS